jgi:molybdate transport system ATP-binding protein
LTAGGPPVGCGSGPDPTADAAHAAATCPRGGLDLVARVQLGALDLDVALRAAPGEVVALLGPNGAGKTTLLRCVAGLQPLDGGRIVLDGAVLDEPAAGVFVPPERRPVGVVFQDYLLFPTMTALENVAFGLRARGTGRHQARAAARAWLERVGLGDHAGHQPRQLSGGQQQRVALARALATEPRLLLLDEPLAALDVGTRSEVRRDLRRHLGGFAGVRLLVTHDPVDAHALADRVVVLEGGRVSQAGTLAQVTAHPRSRYVAELVGVNLLAGDLHHGVLTIPGGGVLVVADLEVADGPALAAVRPQAIALHPDQPHGSPRNCWPATVAEIDQHGDRVRVRLDGALPVTAEITPAALAELGLLPGAPVWASVKATEVVAYPS